MTNINAQILLAASLASLLTACGSQSTASTENSASGQTAAQASTGSSTGGVSCGTDPNAPLVDAALIKYAFFQPYAVYTNPNQIVGYHIELTANADYCVNGKLGSTPANLAALSTELVADQSNPQADIHEYTALDVIDHDVFNGNACYRDGDPNGLPVPSANGNVQLSNITSQTANVTVNAAFSATGRYSAQQIQYTLVAQSCALENAVAGPMPNAPPETIPCTTSTTASIDPNTLKYAYYTSYQDTTESPSRGAQVIILSADPNLCDAGSLQLKQGQSDVSFHADLAEGGTASGVPVTDTHTSVGNSECSLYGGGTQSVSGDIVRIFPATSTTETFSYHLVVDGQNVSNVNGVTATLCQIPTEQSAAISCH